MTKATQKKKRVHLTPEQKKERAKKQAEARMRTNFKKKYKSIFKMASFCMIDSENKHFRFRLLLLRQVKPV